MGVVSLFIFSIIIVVGFAIFLSFLGMVLYDKLLFSEHPDTLKIGCGYFIGVSMMIAVWKHLALVFSRAEYALYLVIILGVCFLIFNHSYYKNIFLKGLSFFKKSPFHLFYLIVPVLFLFMHLHLFLLPKYFDFIYLSPHTIFGIPDGGRYANIATYIFQTDKMPILKQSYGQSLLAAIPLFLGVNTPLLALTIWSTLAKTALYYVIVGFLILLGHSHKKSIAISSVVTFLSCTLSLKTIIVESAHTFPLALSYNSDSLISAGSFFVMALWTNLFFVDSREKKGLKPQNLLIPVIFFLSWSITCGQNFFLWVPCLIGCSVIFMSKGRLPIYNLCGIGIVLTLGLALALQTGGMLTHPHFLDSAAVKIPGILSLDTHISNLMFDPGYPYIEFTNRYLWEARLVYPKSIDSVIDYFSKIKIVSNNLLECFILLFFPILGFVGMNYLLKARKKGEDLLSFLYFFAKIEFLVGFFITFFLRLGPEKWNLNRFLIPGLFFGSIFFAASLAQVRHWILRAGALLLVIIGIWGPVHFCVELMIGNQSQSFHSRVVKLTEFRGFTKRFNKSTPAM